MIKVIEATNQNPRNHPNPLLGSWENSSNKETWAKKETKPSPNSQCYCKVMANNFIYRYFQFYSMPPKSNIFIHIFISKANIWLYQGHKILLHLPSSFSCKWNFWFTLCYSLVYNKFYWILYITFYTSLE